MQDRGNYDIQKLEGDCLLEAAKETIHDMDFVDAIGDCDARFCSYLGDHIINQLAKQRIKKADNDGDSLHDIRMVGLEFRLK